MTTNSTGGNSRMTDEALDPFDLAALRLDQTYSDGVAVKKLITMIRVGKPSEAALRESESRSGLSDLTGGGHRAQGRSGSLSGIADIGGGTCWRVHVGRALHGHHAGRHVVPLAGAVAGSGREA